MVYKAMPHEELALYRNTTLLAQLNGFSDELLASCVVFIALLKQRYL